MRAWTPLLVGPLAALIAFTPVGAIAAAPEDEAAEVDLGQLWREGTTKLETGDYAGAVESLRALYERIATDPEALALRLRVRWSLHQAHLKQYELDKDVSHLRIAHDLVSGYIDELDEAESEQRSEAEQALQEIDAKIAELEQADADAEAARKAQEAKAQEREAEREQLAPREEAPAPTEPDPKAKPLIIAGGVIAGVGLVGGGALGIAGFAMANNSVQRFEDEPQNRNDARDDVDRQNALGTAGAITGGVLLIAGVAILAVGLAKKKKTSVAPTLSRDGGGLVVMGRF